MNLEMPLDNNGDRLAITAADAVAAHGVPPWFGRRALCWYVSNHGNVHLC